LKHKGAMRNIHEIIFKTVTGMGYDLVDIEHSPKVLLIYIDSENINEKVGIDDCVAVSNQLNKVLEVENVAYQSLEVSTPGMDRALKTYAHFVRFVGHEACVTFKQPLLDNQKKFVGIILEPKNEIILCLEIENKQGVAVIDFKIEEIDKAKLSLDAYFPRKNKPSKPNKLKKPKTIQIIDNSEG
jgi:ribosome maturation factor RimP